MLKVAIDDFFKFIRVVHLFVERSLALYLVVIIDVILIDQGINFFFLEVLDNTYVTEWHDKATGEYKEVTCISPHKTLTPRGSIS